MQYLTRSRTSPEKPAAGEQHGVAAPHGSRELLEHLAHPVAPIAALQVFV